MFRSSNFDQEQSHGWFFCTIDVPQMGGENVYQKEGVNVANCKQICDTSCHTRFDV